MTVFLFLNVYSPFSLGVYVDGRLVDSFLEDGKASDVLAIMMGAALKKYSPDEIYYTNGPGNSMSLKIAYITLKTVAVIRQIPLYGVSPFLFNGEKPIRGIGGGFFVKDKNGIMLQKSKDLKEKVLSLPDYSDFTSSKTDAEPFYMIDAV